MTIEEKRAWIYVVVSVLGYGTYVALILGRAGGSPLTEAPYAATLLWTIGAAILAGIVAHIAVSMAAPADIGKKDQRDKEIYRFGEYGGQWFVVAGGVAALVMAMAELDHFWIANVIYLSFVMSSLLSSILKIVAYRRGLPSW
ncbi:hypothetical protein [Nonomuraea sp. NPDC002799]